MTIPKGLITQEMIDEVRRVGEDYRRERAKKDFVNRKWVELNREVVGSIEELPLWAQAYIKALRAELFDKQARLDGDA